MSDEPDKRPRWTFPGDDEVLPTVSGVDVIFERWSARMRAEAWTGMGWANTLTGRGVEVDRLEDAS